MWVRYAVGRESMPHNYSEYVCDSELDLAELPTNIAEGTGTIKEFNAKCSIGSIALVTKPEFLVFMLANDNTWVEL